MYPYYENTKKEIYFDYHKSAHSFDSHFHNKLEIAHCFSGTQEIKVDQTRYRLKAGDTIIIFPNTVHEYLLGDLSEKSEKEETECISVMCNTDLITKYMPEIITMQPECPLIKAEKIPKKTALAFRGMVDAKNKFESVGWAYIAMAGIQEVLELKPMKEAQELNLAPRLMAYIQDNFEKPLTLSYLAKEFGYHPSYIAHFFCDKLKVPFRTYLGAVRSEYVATRIKNSDKTLTEIAYEAGYNSLNTFCYCFKKHFGKTPSQYRKDCMMVGYTKKSLDDVDTQE